MIIENQCFLCLNFLYLVANAILIVMSMSFSCFLLTLLLVCSNDAWCYDSQYTNHISDPHSGYDDSSGYYNSNATQKGNAIIT